MFVIAMISFVENFGAVISLLRIEVTKIKCKLFIGIRNTIIFRMKHVHTSKIKSKQQVSQLRLTVRSPFVVSYSMLAASYSPLFKKACWPDQKSVRNMLSMVMIETKRNPRSDKNLFSIYY